jgi:tRNA/tmRNA/rRNA uracil-C5-methylase (TrmA/RlmC/RlmD family)
MSLVLRIEGLGAEGEGVAHHEGKVVFVPGALPGELVDLDLAACGPRFDRGELRRVVEASPARVSPACEHAVQGGCGGCTMLHAAAPSVAQWKRDVLCELMGHAGLATDVVEATRIVRSGWQGSRTHAHWIPDAKGRLPWISAAPAAGRGERRPIHVEHCGALHPQLEALRLALDGRCAGLSAVDVRVAPTTGDALILLEGNDLPRGIVAHEIAASVILRTKSGDRPLRGQPYIHEQVMGARFRVSAGAFFQGHVEGASLLAELVGECVDQAKGVTRAMDLCAGVGLFALCSLTGAARVLAVESDPAAAADLRVNLAKRSGAAVIEESVSVALRELGDARGAPDLVVADPPRSGLGREALAALLRMGAPRIVLVSCAPRHFATEAAALVRAGWRMERCIPVDQFPGTPHLEVVGLLAR